MPARAASAEWKGTLKEGHGIMKMTSGAYEGPYTFASRFESGKGTNPEELIAAAHSGCFSMALSGALERAGFKATSIKTTATVHLDKLGDGMGIVRIDLDCVAQVPGIDQNKFLETAEGAKKGCPISKALAAVPEITLKAKLV
ncbi:MAG TPA: OsmC family protein [bacterium]|nr:OsmC family protein [bacterium]